MKKILLLIIFQLFAIHIFAQNQAPDMATEMRSSGKIYVVVVCVVIILIGILSLLFSIDRRLKKVEKKNQL